MNAALDAHAASGRALVVNAPTRKDNPTMKRTLPKRDAGSPLTTNAFVNRQHATRCFKAGMTVEQIAAAWPVVFYVVRENGMAKLAQHYDYELNDGSGRYETNTTISSESVDAAIAALKGQPQ